MSFFYQTFSVDVKNNVVDDITSVEPVFKEFASKSFLFFPTNQVKAIKCNSVKHLICTVRDKKSQNKFFIDFKTNIMEYCNTLKNIKIFLRTQNKLVGLQAIMFCRMKENKNYIMNKPNERKQLIKVIEEVMDKHFLDLRGVGFLHVKVESDENLMHIVRILKQRQEKCVEGMLIKLEEAFVNVKGETEEGFQYMTVDECLKILNTTLEGLDKLVKFGEEKNKLKYEELKGIKIICYMNCN